MEIIKKIKEVPNLSLALGFFDGVHIAHQKVIKKAVDFAQQNNLKSAVVTLKNHPATYFNPEFSYIILPADRYKYIEELEVDYLIELDFETVKDLSAIDYIENILVKYLSPKFITTGFNHTFGHKKSGNTQLLKDLQQKYNYIYKEIEPFTLNNETVSSSLIRKKLSNGDIKISNNMLGKNFYIEGTVQKGKQLGAKIGFPTANINYPANIIKIPRGVYKTFSYIDGVKYQGITNFGTCPTVSDCAIETLETHYLDFDGNLYGKTLTVFLEKKLRDEKKFSSIEELKMQIKTDINEVVKPS